MIKEKDAQTNHKKELTQENQQTNPNQSIHPNLITQNQSSSIPNQLNQSYQSNQSNKSNQSDHSTTHHIKKETLHEKVLRNNSLDQTDFFKKSRHFLIMTDSGQPIYSRYGNAIENNGIFATFSAMISKFTFFNESNNKKENLQ